MLGISCIAPEHIHQYTARDKLPNVLCKLSREDIDVVVINRGFTALLDILTVSVKN